MESDSEYSNEYKLTLKNEMDECMKYFGKDGKILKERLKYIIKYFEFEDEDNELIMAEKCLINKNSNEISEEEVRNYFDKRIKNRQPKQYYTNLFLKLADPKTHKVDYNLLKKIFKKAKKDPKHSNKYIDYADIDGDSQIDLNEFLNVVSSVLKINLNNN